MATVLCLLCPVVFRFVFRLLVFFGGRLDLAINWLLFLILFWALFAPSASFLYALFYSTKSSSDRFDISRSWAFS